MQDGSGKIKDGVSRDGVLQKLTASEPSMQTKLH